MGCVGLGPAPFDQSPRETRAISFSTMRSTTDGEPGLSFKCSDLAFEMLPELEHVRPAPYLGRAKWVQVLAGAPLNDGELRAYVGEAHRIVAGKLTRAARMELGL